MKKALSSGIVSSFSILQSQFFGDSQLRAPAARVGARLLVGCLDRLFSDNLQPLRAGVVAAVARLGPEEQLDDPVLQRVKGNHRQPAARRQQLDRLWQRGLKALELAVDGYTQRLERAG